jgi:pyochelin biosynthesis protein PchC
VFRDKRLLRWYPCGGRSLLVCFPHAGAGASAFHAWPQRLAPWADVVVVQMKGREDRLAEPLDDALPDLAGCIADELAASGHRHIVLFGHSMGAIVAWWVGSRLWSRHGAKAHAVVSAQSPSPPALDHAWHPGGIPGWFCGLGEPVPEVLACADMRDIFEATLRADIGWMRREFATSIPAPLPIDVNALHAHDDRLVTRAQMAQWEAHTTGRFTLWSLPGGHLHLVGNPGPTLDLVRTLFESGQPHAHALGPR